MRQLYLVAKVNSIAPEVETKNHPKVVFNKQSGKDRNKVITSSHIVLSCIHHDILIRKKNNKNKIYSLQHFL